MLGYPPVRGMQEVHATAPRPEQEDMERFPMGCMRHRVNQISLGDHRLDATASAIKGPGHVRTCGTHQLPWRQRTG